MWTEALARQADTCVRVCVWVVVAVVVCVHSHASVRNNGKGVQYFFSQIRYPRTLMGNCALCNYDPITILPLPTSSQLLPSAPRHLSCHEKVIYVSPCEGSFTVLSRRHRLQRRARMIGRPPSSEGKTARSVNQKQRHFSWGASVELLDEYVQCTLHSHPLYTPKGLNPDSSQNLGQQHQICPHD